MSAASDIMEKIVAEQLEKRHELLETFVLAYLKETGHKIEELELIEQTDGMRVHWYLRKRGTP